MKMQDCKKLSSKDTWSGRVHIRLPSLWAAADPEVGAELLPLLQGVGEVGPQRLGQEEGRDPAHHREGAHDHQREDVAVRALLMSQKDFFKKSLYPRRAPLCTY